MHYEFDLAPGIYAITSDRGYGYYFPFKRSSFHIESGATTMINVLPSLRVLSIGTVIGDKDVTELAPEPKYETLRLMGIPTPEVSLVIQYDHKLQRASSVEYKNAARPFSGVVVTYDALTVIADQVNLDKGTLRVEAKGNVIVEDGKTRTHTKRKVIEFRGGKAIVKD